MNHPSNALLKATGLTRLASGTAIVQDVSLTLERGEVLGLLGLNGAGKSTTLQLLAGVLAPDHGRVTICGHCLQSEPELAKAQLGYLPDVPPLYSDMRVIDYLRFAGRIRGIKGKALVARIDTLLHELDLVNRRKTRIARLSKGFKQRVGIAQALIHKPAVLILDEPSSGLDPQQMYEMRDLIKQQSAQCAVIFSSHLLGEVEDLCERVAVLHDGRLIHTAKTASQPQTDWFSVRFDRAVALADLQQLAGVLDAQQLGDGHYRLQSRDGDDLLRQLIARHHRVREFGPQHSTLESLFRELVGPGGSRAAGVIDA